jgi:hypothetical protein
MVGPRQQQILDLLRDGPHSLSPLDTRDRAAGGHRDGPWPLLCALEPRPQLGGSSFSWCRPPAPPARPLPFPGRALVAAGRGDDASHGWERHLTRSASAVWHSGNVRDLGHKSNVRPGEAIQNLCEPSFLD